MREICDEGPVKNSYKRLRSHRKLSPLPSGQTSITGYLSTRIISPDAVRHASPLLRRLTSYREQADKAHHILRLVVHTLAM